MDAAEESDNQSRSEPEEDAESNEDNVIYESADDDDEPEIDLEHDEFIAVIEVVEELPLTIPFAFDYRPFCPYLGPACHFYKFWVKLDEEWKEGCEIRDEFHRILSERAFKNRTLTWIEEELNVGKLTDDERRRLSALRDQSLMDIGKRHSFANTVDLKCHREIPYSQSVGKFAAAMANKGVEKLFLHWECLSTSFVDGFLEHVDSDSIPQLLECAIFGQPDEEEEDGWYEYEGIGEEGKEPKIPYKSLTPPSAATLARMLQFPFDKSFLIFEDITEDSLSSALEGAMSVLDDTSKESAESPLLAINTRRWSLDSFCSFFHRMGAPPRSTRSKALRLQLLHLQWSEWTDEEFDRVVAVLMAQPFHHQIGFHPQFESGALNPGFQKLLEIESETPLVRKLGLSYFKSQEEGEAVMGLLARCNWLYWVAFEMARDDLDNIPDGSMVSWSALENLLRRNTSLRKLFPGPVIVVDDDKASVPVPSSLIAAMEENTTLMCYSASPAEHEDASHVEFHNFASYRSERNELIAAPFALWPFFWSGEDEIEGADMSAVFDALRCRVVNLLEVVGDTSSGKGYSMPEAKRRREKHDG